jgi:hypothetical protein
LLGRPVVPKSQREAASLVASSVSYVAAAVAVLQAQDQWLVDRVLLGRISLLAAAAKVNKRAKLVTALNAASEVDLAETGRTIGIDRIWDNMIAPNI